ncbi:MAG: peptide chain release factor 2 [Candidatus Omnitrophota bacterium]
MFEDIKAKINTLEVKLANLRGYLDIDKKKKLIEELTQLMSNEGFWDNSEKSTGIVKELKGIKSSVEPWESASKKLQELKELAEILQNEDSGLILEMARNIEALSEELEKLEFKTLLSSPFDSAGAILSINAGAGGTESCDWVSMLLRMYTRFAESHGYTFKTTDILFGEEAGIKNVTAIIDGEYAYGYLKAERGVHRLVRISPFDSNKRRHTSFASVDVIPEIEEDAEIKIDETQLRIDVYRSKGAGGQSVNTTDSAVRITHIPSGIVAQCQNERSQYQNKQMALKILKARLFEFEREKKDRQLQEQVGAGEKKKIEFGSQIRSYVMHPYSMVKDHRTDYETGDVASIMDGALDKFIEAYLRKQQTNQNA